jgi:hypothetical protein
VDLKDWRIRRIPIWRILPRKLRVMILKTVMIFSVGLFLFLAGGTRADVPDGKLVWERNGNLMFSKVQDFSPQWKNRQLDP